MEQKTDQPLDGNYWNNRYITSTSGWDLGVVSPPLQQYIDQLTDKSISILIPGCGNTYEADYLLAKGFTNITVIDIASILVEQLTEKYAGNPNIRIILGNFFDLNDQFDLVLEQTFFCALDPVLRENYVSKMYAILKPNGKLVGLLFDRLFEEQGPPFGGTKAEYEKLFSGKFIFKTFEPAHNSFSKRMDTELFIILQRKAD